MRLKPAAFALIALLPALATAHASEGLSDRQQRIRQALQQDRGEDTAAPARLPPLKCEKNDYSIKESGKKTTVHNADELINAMKGAKGGDVIILGAGNYGWVDIRDLSYSSYVKIQGSSGATLSHLGLWNMKNVQVDGVSLVYGDATGQTWKPKVIEVSGSENIRIVNSSIVGNPNAKQYGEELGDTGVRFVGSKNVVLANSKISKVAVGVRSQVVTGFVYKHNILTDIACDVFMHQQTHNGVFESNYIERIHPQIYTPQGTNCHSDFFQFDAGKGRHDFPPDSNIVIRGNVMLQGSKGSECSGYGSECGAVQGIFLGGAMGTMNGKEHLYKDFTITDNVYCASGKNGIAVSGRNILVKNNAHYTCPPPFGETHMSNIRVDQPFIDSKVENNVTGRVSGQAEAISKAKQLSWLNNCVLKGL